MKLVRSGLTGQYRVAMPTISLPANPPIPYTEALSISIDDITCATSGATIWVSLDNGITWEEWAVSVVADPVIEEDPVIEGLVSISCATEGADINYTLDEDGMPTPVYGTPYTEPFQLIQTASVHAIAFKGGLIDSNVVTTAIEVTEVPPIQISPDDVSGLFLWYDAASTREEPPYEPGNQVFWIWNNASTGYELDATLSSYAPNPPVFTEYPGLNSPAFAFAGGGMNMGMEVPLALSGHSALTAFIVMKTNSSNTLQRALSLNAYLQEIRFAIDYNANNKVSVYARDDTAEHGGAQAVTTATAMGTGWIIISAKVLLADGVMAIWTDNGSPNAVNPACSFYRTYFSGARDFSMIGDNITANAHLNGGIAEVLLYHEDISDQDRSALHDYLASKWMRPS